MVTTYKRAKDKSRLTGEENIIWDYYTKPILQRLAQSSPAETKEQPGPSSAIQDRQASGSKRSKTAHSQCFFSPMRPMLSTGPLPWSHLQGQIWPTGDG
uniref:Si:ch1073-357b18.4 n=1 Tax=Nothobranchius korthausae TaxID=1143690 RepID=A0A1A8G0I8_9TELE